MNGEYVKVGRLRLELVQVSAQGTLTTPNLGEVTDVYRCPVCSALVADPAAHDSWHGGDE